MEQAFRASPEAQGFPFGDERYAAVLRSAARLIDTPRHYGLHPGGVVVSPGLIRELVACQPSSKGPIVTQLDKDGVEEIGLVKMDLLGNRALTVIDDCLTMLRAHGIDVDINAIAEDDPRTAQTLRTGRTIGCFQIESPGMRNLLQQTGAATMDDVIQAVALIRPGPAGSGMKDAYIRRFRGLEDPTPPHPRLTEVLRETYGVMLYQEDVMQAAAHVAGMDLAEADQLRRALQKRRKQDIKVLCKRFMSGCAQEGVEHADAQRVWELIAGFASFAFCKAHAVTYGRIAYRCVWLKTHHPALFLTAFLGSDTGYYPQRVYIEEARRLGTPILGPDINRSQASFTAEWIGERPALRVGLAQLKGLSRATLERALATRATQGPILSLPDFLERTQARTDETKGLIQCGAFDSFDRTRPELLWRLHLLRKGGEHSLRGANAQGLDLTRLAALRSTARSRSLGSSRGSAESNSLDRARARTGGWSGRGLGVSREALEQGESALLFPEPELPAPVLPALPDTDPETRGRLEFELLGLTISQHPTLLFPCPADERIAQRFGRGSGPARGNFHSSSKLRPHSAKTAASEQRESLEANGDTAGSTIGEEVRPVNPILCSRLEHFRGGRVTLRGWPAASRRVRTSSGRLMRFLTLEDESGLAEVVLFPEIYRRDGHLLNELGNWCVTGIVEDNMGACALHAERVW